MISNYLLKIQSELNTGNALEHSYRPALKELIESMNPIINAVNEPTRSEFGSPDFIFLNSENRNFIHGYAETKDIYINLDQIEKSEQLKRYLGYPNLILTNYLEFRFYRNGEKYQTIEIAKKTTSGIIPIEGNFEHFERELVAFLQSPPESIRNGKRLAEIMGGKAARIRANVVTYLETDNEKNKEILKVYTTMKELLVHDLETKAFADMYAQTLVYGLFVARYYDDTPENFTRSEARDLIPASNPFLQRFFDHIAGTSFDKRLGYIVDELCDVFSVSDVNTIINKHYKLTESALDKDPIIHFYEDFLKEYDPELKKKMGAYYTPVPVVQFIIKAVDEILIKDFNLANGLANTSTVEMKFMQQGTKAKRSIPKVQILDPAVGTATFLNETIKLIYSKFSGQEGRWESYVENELLPRLHGFELMMAPYTIAHLKLAMTLKETGIKQFKKRLSVYLTNSLEEGIKLNEGWFSLGFADAINEESRAASVIKEETPVMVILGNPPYSISSSNKGAWIQSLIKDYKENLNERKINLDDDYIKFIRFAEHFIEKNGTGIVAMITNNSFLDGVTHRQMRKHLLESFDDIYILDLHGNAKKKETTPDGTKDENVFNIQQGVSINLFVRKNSTKKGFGKIYHTDLYGKRMHKFEVLNKNNWKNIKWQINPITEPNYFFVPKESKSSEEYYAGFGLDDLMPIYNSGIQTKRDKICISFNEDRVKNIVSDFNELNSDQIRQKYNLPPDGRDWKIDWAKKDLLLGYNIVDILYRPFDIRKTIYTTRSKGFIAYPRQKTSSQFFKHENIGLIFTRFDRQLSLGYFFVTNILLDLHALDSAGDSMMVAPLYLYHEDGTKTSNLKKEIVDEIEKNVDKVTPQDIFDYVYAVLYSSRYRESYKEFLKIGFPKVPYPKDKNIFIKLVEFGSELRELHLLESSKVTKYITTFPIGGSEVVEKIEYKSNKIFINETQYFGNVPELVWNFYIGGYQPVQKWLKDRKGRILTNKDIEHYQKIIVSLVETDRIMKEIDKLLTL